MSKLVLIALFLTAICTLNGCTTAATATSPSSATLAEQQQCSSAAKAWFKDNYSGYEMTKLALDYSNHFNRKLNRCLVKVGGASEDGSYTYIFEVMENRQYAVFDVRGPFCDVGEIKCKDSEEFEKLSAPLMND